MCWILILRGSATLGLPLMVSLVWIVQGNRSERRVYETCYAVFQPRNLSLKAGDAVRRRLVVITALRRHVGADAVPANGFRTVTSLPINYLVTMR